MVSDSAPRPLSLGFVSCAKWCCQSVKLSLMFKKLPADLCTADASPALRDLVITRPTSQADDISAVQNWLGNCMASHTACRILSHSDPLTSLRGETPPLPTRVVDVGPGSGTNDTLRLLETNGQKGMYLTLSHCWGTDPITTTTTSNLEVHKNSIPFDSLPLNFQHAIQFTRRLGMQYLWIDSLCIVQDSAADWEVESSRMAEIYHHSALTLSAANSVAATQGFLRPRIPSSKRGVRVEASHQHVFYLSPQISNYDQDVERSPLARRGWTLQERLLSRRNLFFGVDQSHWECQTSRFSENTPVSHLQVEDISGGVSSFGSLFSMSPPGDGATTASEPRATLSDIFPQSSLYQVSGQRQVNSMSSIPPSDNDIKIYKLWYHLIGEFTKRSLTVGDDKLPALSGIVKVFSAALNTGQENNIYVAGLWAGDLARGLLWQNFGPTPEAQVRMRSPSWSWTSIDGPIQPGTWLKSQICDIKDASCEIGRGGSKDPHGKVEFARLRLTGRLCLVPVLERMGPDFQDGMSTPYVLTNAILKDAAGREIGAGYLDQPSCAWEKRKDDVWCLPVRHPGGAGGGGTVGLGSLQVDCLLLCKVPGTADQDTFWRVGTAKLSTMSSDMYQLIAPFQEFLAGSKERSIVIV